MALPPVLKIGWRTFFNPAAWLGYGEVKANTLTVTSILRAIFSPERPLHTETFEEAMSRQGLTEADIIQRQQTFHLYTLAFGFLGLVLFAYSFFLLFAYFSITGFLLGIATSGLFFSQAFKFDFWAFQLRERRLGATFVEWKRNFLGEKGNSK